MIYINLPAPMLVRLTGSSRILDVWNNQNYPNISALMTLPGLVNEMSVNNQASSEMTKESSFVRNILLYWNLDTMLQLNLVIFPSLPSTGNDQSRELASKSSK